MAPGKVCRDLTGDDVQRELVQRAMGGDHEAFCALVRPSLSRLYAVASLILHDTDRAQDAVQDALILAWRDVRALREPDAWEAWLHRLTVRACYQAARRDRRRGLTELHVEPVGEAAQEDMTVMHAERDRMARELQHLSMDQRVLMVLHFYLDLPLTDAAEILGIPVGTAKSRMHRGLASLRESLASQADTPALSPVAGRVP